jgi:hypothetical protein
MEQIKGYDYGKATLEKSPITIQDLNLLKKTLLWSGEDDRYLKMAGDVLKDQTNDVLNLWYGYVGGNEHLVYYFAKKRSTQHGLPLGSSGKVRTVDFRHLSKALRPRLAELPA